MFNTALGEKYAPPRLNADWIKLLSRIPVYPIAASTELTGMQQPEDIGEVQKEFKYLVQSWQQVFLILFDFELIDFF